MYFTKRLTGEIVFDFVLNCAIMKTYSFKCVRLGSWARISVTASSPLFVYALLSFCLVYFVACSDIALELLLNRVLLCILLWFFFLSTLARVIGWKLRSHKTLFNPSSICECPKSYGFSFQFSYMFWSSIWQQFSLK